MMRKIALALGLALVLTSAHGGKEEASGFKAALSLAERSLDSGELPKAREWIQRALERDKKSVQAWTLRARWAEAAEDRDDLVYSLHQQYRHSVVQGVKAADLKALRTLIEETDPIAKDLFGMDERFIAKLIPIAEDYEKDGRPHSAIRVWKQVQSLDPENVVAQSAIERIAASPDPSLAGDAKPKDLFEDVSDEWIREHDAEHATWKTKAKLERENYITYTDAGYEVLVQAGEAMEQMNAFYRIFFQFGTEEHGGAVPRIGLNIFKTRDEYLELGIGPPAEWSGGHFTGNFVETYIGAGGFQQMTGTLFHEAAHQFVSLATTATGWLNEGLASFFEGTRILPNGTVIMNMPANHRLYPLVTRMEKGWMTGPDDGTDPENANATPETAPTFRIILENKYTWGPPWYAPTWGVVYFLYNYQDPIDGRFVYRAAFQEFINSSGGRVGNGAVKNFQEVVLANPSKPLKGVDRPKDAPKLALPKTVEELDPIWKEWCTSLRQEQRGLAKPERPYKQWGRYAVLNKDYIAAQEHYEKGLVETPDDIELLVEFAELLDKHCDNSDRGARLVLEAIHYVESNKPVDEKKLKECEKLLSKLDPKQKTLGQVQEEMAAAGRGLVQRYRAADLPLMTMDVAWRLATRQDLPDLFVAYEEALRESGKSLRIWDLAYNEASLEGWNSTGVTGGFEPNGTFLDAKNGEFSETRFDYRFLTLDKITTGDFSMEAEVLATRGKVNFCGFVFGSKGADFHGMVVFPGKTKAAEGTANSGFLQLMSSNGGTPRIWRNLPLEMESKDARSSSGRWHTLRLDVAGRFADMWFDGELRATHEFASRDAVLGNFGLLVGPGEARFRDVRYFASDPRDPAARIERAIRLETLERDDSGAVDGSYLGQVSPFPTIGRWVQGERKSWDERGYVPQLLVFFSLNQMGIVPVDGWLRSLGEKKAELGGLEIISIASPNDDAAIEAWLKEHPLPGDVAIDSRPGVGIGESFERYFIDRFNLPRVILLDLDGTVIWEGDPGIPSGDDPGPPYVTVLDDPLADLVTRRKLGALAQWKVKWTESALPALAAADLKTALPVLLESEEFEARYSPEVAQAEARLSALRATFNDLESAAIAIQREGADPALETLVGWAPLFEIKVPKKWIKSRASVLKGPTSKDWKNILKRCVKVANDKKFEAEDAAGFLAYIEGKAGVFPEALLEELRPAVEASDLGQVQALARSAPTRTASWLFESYFGWAD